MREKLRRATMAMAIALALAACGATPEAPPSPAPQVPSIAPSAGPTTTARPPSPSPSPGPTLTPTPRIGEDLAQAAYLVPLQTRHRTADRAWLYAAFDRPVSGALFYWPLDRGEGAGEWLRLPEDSSLLELTLQDLEAGTDYGLRLGLQDSDGELRPPRFLDAAWAPLSFETDDPQRWPLRVGVIGDSGFGGPATRKLVQAMAQEQLDLVIHTGDLVYNAYQQPDAAQAYAVKLFAPFAPLLRRMPLYPVVGNHDIYDDSFWRGRPFYELAFPPIAAQGIESGDPAGRNRWYALWRGPYQFLMLNTQVLLAGGEDAQAQDAWLSQRLEDPRFRLSIPVFHVPPYTSGLHTDDGALVRQRWLPLFQAAQVPLVLSGHDHNYERLQVGGVTFVVSGGGSARLYARRAGLPESQIFAARTHYLVLELEPDGLLLTARSAAGQIIDRVQFDLGS